MPQPQGLTQGLFFPVELRSGAASLCWPVAESRGDSGSGKAVLISLISTCAPVWRDPEAISLPAVDIISFWGVSLSYLKSTLR